MLIIGLLAIIFAGFIFVVLGKVPLFRWLGVTIITIIKYALITFFNVLAIGVISIFATIGVALALALFHYLEWELFMVGQETLIITHNGFFVTTFLMSLCFVTSILLGTLIFSFVPLARMKYVIASYVTGFIVFILVLPMMLQAFTPEIEGTLLGMFVLYMSLPLLGLIYAISTGHKRDERRKEMTLEEIAREDSEEKRKGEFRKQFIFPWIRTRAR